MDWMRLEKIEKKFDLFGIQTHPIPLNPHGLRANRTSPNLELLSSYYSTFWDFFFAIRKRTLHSYGYGPTNKYFFINFA
jgi:hypothetical protein